MKFDITSQSVRAMADRILGDGPVLNKAAALELLAKAFGYRNFDTLSGVLKQAPTPPAAPCVLEGVPLGTTLWLECVVCAEFGEGPEWANVSLDAAFLAKLCQLRELCVAHGLSHVAVDQAPTDWKDYAGYGSYYNMRDWQLYVTGSRFWFRGTPKHCRYAVETRAVDIAALEALLRAGEGGSEAFAWIGSALYHDSSAAQQVFEKANGDSEFSLDDIAEWVGLHYRVNFNAEPPARQQEWIDRYLETMNASA